MSNSIKTGLLPLLWFAALPVLAAELQPFTLEYNASYDDNSASASRSLSFAAATNQWELHSLVEMRGFGVTLYGVEEHSRFGWRDDQPIPVEYSYEQNGFGARERSMKFAANGRSASYTDNQKSGELTLTPPVFDALNSNLALRHHLQGGSEAGKTITLQVADKREVSTQNYRIVGNESVKTPAGTFATIHVSRIRDGDSKRTTDLWLAPELDYAMVKFEQNEPKGGTIKLTLKKGKVGAITLPKPN